MKNLIIKTERGFEKVVFVATFILGNSFTFLMALCLVIFWFSNRMFYIQDIHETIGDFILAITFLSLFIIQKSFNRFSASLHLKVNELVSVHDKASNTVIHTDSKTEHELKQLSKEYPNLENIEEKEINLNDEQKI